MNPAWAAVLVAALSMSAGALGVVVRLSMRWASIQSDLSHLVADKDRVHAEMLAQMREDRSVTDKRLRWLEENLWHSRGMRP